MRYVLAACVFVWVALAAADESAVAVAGYRTGMATVSLLAAEARLAAHP